MIVKVRWFEQANVAGLALSMTLGFVFANPPAANAQQDAETFYKQNCAACHTIGGGKLLGPDLKGVTKARSTNGWKSGSRIPKP
jgi:mono/diheme cytochrome c family protein